MIKSKVELIKLYLPGTPGKIFYQVIYKEFFLGIRVYKKIERTTESFDLANYLYEELQNSIDFKDFVKKSKRDRIR